jgi:hypothetical protein
MGKPVCGILAGDCFQGCSDCPDEIGLCARLARAQVSLEFAPHLLDWAEVWRIGRKKQSLRANLLEQ